MARRLSPTDLVLGVAGIAGLAAFLLLYAAVFPQANLSLEVTRPEAVVIANDFLGSRGADLDGFKNSVVFSGDDVALNFLQRHVGLEEARR